MSNLEKAVILMDEEWVNSLTEMEDYVPSEKHLRAIYKIDDKLRGGKYHRFTRRTIALLVAAAILLSAATIAVANEASRNYIIERFKEYSIYKVEDTIETEVTPIEVGYIPEGFELSQTYNYTKIISVEYFNGEKHFSIEKTVINNDMYFDTEEYNYKSIVKNNTDYLLFKSQDNNIGVIWNDGDYSYRIDGNLLEEEAINVASSTK